MNPDLPLKLVIQVEATNGSTLLNGIEAVAKQLSVHYHIPKTGEVYEDKYWKTTVVEAVTELPSSRRSYGEDDDGGGAIDGGGIGVGF